MLSEWILVSALYPLPERMRQKADTKRRHASTLYPLLKDSKKLFEVLRLGSESPARRAENFHTNIPRPGSIQDSQCPARHGTVCYASRIAGIVPERPQNVRCSCKTGQRPRFYSEILSRRVGGWCLAHDIVRSHTDGRRTNAEQEPNAHRTDVEQTSTKSRKT